MTAGLLEDKYLNFCDMRRVGAGLAPADRCFVFLYFSGGWDVLLSLDPRDPNVFTPDRVAETRILAGYSLLANDSSFPTQVVTPTERAGAGPSNIKFGPAIGRLADHYDQMCVIRGINMATVAHEVGFRYFLTGKEPNGIESYNDRYPGSANALRVSRANDLILTLSPSPTQLDSEIEKQLVNLRGQSVTCEADAYNTRGLVGQYRDAQSQMATVLGNSLNKSFTYADVPTDSPALNAERAAAFTAMAMASGGTISATGAYVAGALEGLDLIEVRDSTTGEEALLQYRVSLSAAFRAVPAKLALPAGASVPLETVDGSGQISWTVNSGPGHWRSPLVPHRDVQRDQLAVAVRLLKSAMARIWIPLPDADFDATEVAAPWKVLTRAGHEVTFVTEFGRTPAAADPLLLTGVLFGKLGAHSEPLAWYAEMISSPEFRQPVSWGGVDVTRFEALVLAGGHAQGMKQYLGSEALQGKVRRRAPLREEAARARSRLTFPKKQAGQRSRARPA